MKTDMRQRVEEDRALRWLKRRLEWENILSALREAGQESPAEPTAAEQEPAAA
jgi:ribosomal protein S21